MRCLASRIIALTIMDHPALGIRLTHRRSTVRTQDLGRVDHRLPLDLLLPWQSLCSTVLRAWPGNCHSVQTRL